MSAFRFYLDLRCPFCFVQSRRLSPRKAELLIVPQTVRHERSLPQPARPPAQEEQRNLADYFERIARVEDPADHVRLRVPPAWPNTEPASLAIVAALRHSPDLAFGFAHRLMEALWLDGRDVSSSMVINLVARDAGIKKLAPTTADEETLHTLCGAPNRRTSGQSVVAAAHSTI
ncbi:MAG: DsbA family protein [Myxococcales bacterium]|nr:DsbA family protein [Myxococcales bacterium]